MLSKKKKVRNAVVFVLLIILTLGSVNYYVDSYAIIRVSYDDIAQHMLDGDNVIGLTESLYNDRYLAVATIQNMKEPVDCIILGSSRSMVYGREHFGIESFHNFSLSGAKLKDYYGVVGYLANEDLLPESIIMEIGGPLFFAGDTEIRYTYLQGGIDYLEGLMTEKEAVCVAPEVGKQYQQLLAIDYFKYNLQCLLEGSSFKVEYTEDVQSQSKSVVMSDGSLAYREELNKRTAEVVDSMIAQAVSANSLYKIAGYTEMSDELVGDFEKLVEWLVQNGVEVSFFLPPYAENIYSHIQNSGATYVGVLNTEEYILKYAKENDIKVYGSYSPQGCNLKTEDLIDEYHMRREGAEKAFYLREID